jgi:hypothetical protein
MERVGPIPHEGAVIPKQGQSVSHTPNVKPSAAQEADRVELSAAARRAADVTAERIAEIRAHIADDSYLTPEKLEVAIAGLLRDALRER